MKWTYVRLAPLAVALLVVAAAAARAEDQPFDQKITELNNLSGNEAVFKKARELSKDKANALKLLKYADDKAKLDSKKLKYAAAFTLALTAHQLKEYDIANRFYKICEKLGWNLKKRSWITEGFEGQYMILLAQKKYEDAEELCLKLLEQIDKEDGEEFRRLVPAVEEQLITVLAHQGKVEKALELANSAVRRYDGAPWYFLRVKAMVLHEAGRDEEAAKAYLEAIERAEKDENLPPPEQERFVDRCRYLLSNVYVELNQVDKAADELKALLKKKPDNPGYNNDLGYIWADHDMNLDESEKLIRKALELERKQREERKKKGELDAEDDHDNAAYLDSLGWVLFKKKQYAEAKKPLLEATKYKEGQHLEILDHLADVHMALGEKAEAIKVWEKALEQDANTRRDLKRRAEVAKKLKQAKGGTAAPPAGKPAETKPEEKKPGEKKPEKK